MRMTIVVTLIAMTSLLGGSACDRPSVPPSAPSTMTAFTSDRSPSWIEHGNSLLVAKRCGELRAFLRGIPASEVSAKWYELRGLGEAMCWSYSRNDVDKRAALSSIDEGMRRYPEAAFLIADKGGLLEIFGDTKGAQSFYDRAVQVATTNLRRNPESREDRFILRHLGKEQSPLTSVQLPTMTMPNSATDLEDARPEWQQRTWQLIVARDCKGAVDYLTANALSDTRWYAMYSQADLLCWQDGLGDQYKQHALTILNVGLETYGDSPRLLKSKAEYYEATGARMDAKRFRQLAKTKATVLSSTGKGSAKQEAEEVLNELRLTGGKQ
jgi:hypothetical protein